MSIIDCYTWNDKAWSGIPPCEQDADETNFCDENYRVVPTACGKDPSQCVPCGKALSKHLYQEINMLNNAR